MKKFILILLFCLINIFPQEFESGSEKIWEEIYNENFKSANDLVKNQLNQDKENLQLLSLHLITLNGLEKYKEASKIKSKLESIWKSKHKKNYLQENYPINLSSYLSAVVIKPNDVIIGAEYYIPYPISKNKAGFYYNKITVYNKETKKPDKFFKLEKSSATENEFILFEVSSGGKAKKVKNYGTSIPDIKNEIKSDIRN